MVDLPTLPNEVPQLRAPQSRLSPGDIAAPYQELADTLNKTGEVLMKDVAVPAAHQAGLQAVTRDADGNVQVQRAPIFGDASTEYMRAVKFSAVAEGEGSLKRDDIALRQQYRDNPEGYRTAAEAYRQKVVDQYTKIAGPEVGLTLGKLVDATTTQTYRGLLTEHERLTLQRADKSIEAQIQSGRDDLVAMARGGVSSGPTWDAAVNKIKTLTEERVNNPRLAYPREQADYDLQHLDGELKANGFLYHVDQVYKDPGVGPDGEPQGGAKAALEAAKSILTDQSIKLTPQQREAFYHKAVGEVRANEAERRQDLYLTRAAATDLKTASSLGLPIEPEQVDRVAKQFYDRGDPGGAARLYAWAGRAPLNDEFGRQPLTAQTAQLTQLRSSYQGSPENAAALRQTAGNLGIAPRDLAAAISYETRGTFNPGIVGGKGNAYRGLIQFGPEEQRKYGIEPGQSFPEQMKAVEGFLRDRGVKPGMGLPEIYKTIIGGNPNVSLSAADQNGTIAQHLGNIQNAHYESADRFLGSPTGPAPDPASSLWLTANRERTIASETTKGWAAMMKEWNEKGITPNPQTTRAVIEGARATGNHMLLDQIGADLERVNIVKEQAEGPLAGQHAAIAQLRQAASAGDLSVGNAAILKQLEQKNAAIEKGLADNPIATATANFPDKLRAPPPLDPGNQAAFRGGLQMRAGIAAFAAQNWQTKALPALDKADIEGLQGTLEKADPATRARIFSDITAAIPDEHIRNATFGKLAQKDGKAATMAFAGALYNQAPDTAASIIRGQHAMEVDERNNPAKEGEGKEAFHTALDKTLPPGAFSLAGRTDPTGPYATMRSAVIARYADLTAQSGDRKFSETRLKQATDDVTGGILSHNGAQFIAPQRGMTQSTFDRVLWNLTDQDLAGATTLAGEPVNRDYLRRNAQLESYGDGRYLVRLGSDPMRPIYAVQGANTERPAPFVLDLRGRKPGDPKPSGVEMTAWPRG